MSDPTQHPSETSATAAEAAPGPAAGAAAVEAPQQQFGPLDLDAELEALRAKLTELTDQSLRAQAEAQNARRRAEEEVAKARKFAVESFAENLLAVVDSLEAALGAKNATAEQLREGTEATHRQLIGALERNKVFEISPEIGARFDPTREHAVSLVPADQEANTIVAVIQKGYMIADRILRPALVMVAAPK